MILSSLENKNQIKLRDDFKILNIDKVFECSAIEIIIKENKKTILICLYRAPSGSFTDFLGILDNVLDKIQKESKSFVITGDFNLNLLIDGNDQKAFLNLVSEYGGRAVIREPTRVTATSATLIDNFITNLPYVNSSVQTCEFSDHDIIALSIFQNEVSTLSKT